LPLHVDDAARAALLAIGDVPTGIYNIVEPNDSVSGDKAHRFLAWREGERMGTSHPG
jgi:nucleoside-diphosphate-sugar epimerase